MNKVEWMRGHTNCPKCKSANVTFTEKAVAVKDQMNYSDEVNTAKCDDCGWKGMLKNLIESPTLEEDRKNIEQVQIAIRTIDYAGEDGKVDVYMNGMDIMEFLQIFGQKLINNLTDEDTINYTDKMLNEIFGVLMSTMISHTQNRFKKAAEQQESETPEAGK